MRTQGPSWDYEICPRFKGTGRPSRPPKTLDVQVGLGDSGFEIQVFKVQAEEVCGFRAWGSGECRVQV